MRSTTPATPTAAAAARSNTSTFNLDGPVPVVFACAERPARTGELPALVRAPAAGTEISTSDDPAAGQVTGRGDHPAAVSVADIAFDFVGSVETVADFCDGTSGLTGAGAACAGSATNTAATSMPAAATAVTRRPIHVRATTTCLPVQDIEQEEG
ncbi:hypothetical protein GCM10009827_013870 [Dactylosporangium maewongense]|uniref:Uncharacterized protein n=1 Tax=Dactylosporangium maewongense TaxID=634393 RepID=A0ABN1ZQP1_9ACTN